MTSIRQQQIGEVVWSKNHWIPGGGGYFFNYNFVQQMVQIRAVKSLFPPHMCGEKNTTKYMSTKGKNLLLILKMLILKIVC